MFIKLVANSSASNTATSWKNASETIRDLLNGTITGTGGLSTTYWNTSASSITGLYPQTNSSTDTFNNFSVSTNTTSTSDNYLIFDFNHAERSVSYPYHCNIKLYWTATGTYGTRFRYADGNGSNERPYNSTAYYTTGGSANQKYISDFPNETFLIWANKHAFVIQQFNTSYMTTMGVFGYDASSANEYQYDSIGNQRHGPFISLGSYMYTNRWNTGVADETAYDRFWVGANAFNAPDQSYQGVAAILDNTSTTNVHGGYSVSLDNEYLYINPGIWQNVYPLRNATGHTHQLIPTYIGHNNDDADSYPFNGRFKTLYRTSDDIAAPGASITFDGTTYANLMLYKTGAASGNAANTQNACFLIPTTVDGR